MDSETRTARPLVSDVAEHLALKDAAARHAEIAPAVAAVNEQVARWHGYADGERFSDSHFLGAVMLAAHLYRRRNTPGGVEQFNELGVAYVQRSDPHVSQLLGLGAWTPPRIG